MRTVAQIAAAGTLLVGGFLLGHSAATRGVAEPLRAQARELEELRGSVDGLTRAVSLLSVIAPQAAHATTTTAAPSPAPEASPQRTAEPPEEPRVQDEARIEQANIMLAQATSRGQWSRRDEAMLRQLRIESPDTDWLPILKKLAAGVNSGQLRPPPVELDVEN